MLIHVMNICAKFHIKSLSSREIGVNGRTDGQPQNMMLSACYCWRRHEKTASNSDVNIFMPELEPYIDGEPKKHWIFFCFPWQSNFGPMQLNSHVYLDADRLLGAVFFSLIGG